MNKIWQPVWGGAAGEHSEEDFIKKFDQNRGSIDKKE